MNVRIEIRTGDHSVVVEGNDVDGCEMVAGLMAVAEAAAHAHKETEPADPPTIGGASEHYRRTFRRVRNTVFQAAVNAERAARRRAGAKAAGRAATIRRLADRVAELERARDTVRAAILNANEPPDTINWAMAVFDNRFDAESTYGTEGAGKQ